MVLEEVEEEKEETKAEATEAACDADFSLSRIGLHTLVPHMDALALEQARSMDGMARCEAYFCGGSTSLRIA